jgi:hypothetical protein
LNSTCTASAIRHILTVHLLSLVSSIGEGLQIFIGLHDCRLYRFLSWLWLNHALSDPRPSLIFAESV